LTLPASRVSATASAPTGQPFLRRLVTPEGLDLRLTLASASERASAFLLDGLIIVATLIVLSILAIAAFIGMREDGREVIAMIWLLGAFLLRNGYFVLFELGGRAATPGKRALGLRVVARDGGRLTTEAILVRNALREIEVFLPLTLLGASLIAGESVAGVAIALGLIWSGTFLLFPLLNADRLRVGDMVAGTWVVRAPRAPLLADLATDGARELPRFAFTADQTAAYGVKELEILEEVLRRRDAASMKAVAKRIRAKIDFSQPLAETDQAFLAAYYAALRARLEHRLLFGHRRKDKFDTA
jgi:uncharacterized RDD family membrane protein YckC